MSDDRARLDPRFDPAFQRGYDGVMPSGSSATPTPATAAPNSAPAVAPPAAAPPSTPEPRTLPREEVVPSAAASTSSPRTLLTPDAFVADEPRRLNPWLIALGAVSVLLTIGGLLLITRLRDLFADTQNSAEFDYVVLQSLIIGAPILVGLGLATGIGLLFVLAVRRSR
jgi:hypothetical protein